MLISILIEISIIKNIKQNKHIPGFLFRNYGLALPVTAGNSFFSEGRKQNMGTLGIVRRFDNGLTKEG